MMNRLYILLLLSVLSSCSKESFTEPTSLEVNLLDLEVQTTESGDTDDANTLTRAATNTTAYGDTPVEVANIPFNQHFGISVSLSRDLPNSSSENGNTLTRAAGITNSGPNSWKLDNGVKYRLLAYDNNESKVIDTVYTVGQYSGGGLNLNSGSTYTFIVYSILSKSQVPAAPAGKLSDAVFTNIDGNTDFIHFRKVQKLNPGKNALDVTMKHVFSQLTTSINSAAIGNITTVKARVGDHYLSPTISLNSGNVLAYNNKATNGKDIVFANTSTTSAANDATIICNNGSITSTITIDEITINNVTKKAISIPGIKLAPGTRYVLTLKIKTFTPDAEPGIELGNKIYAPGNLTYDRNSNTYSFSTKGEGDLWFKNYVKPRRNDLDSRPWGQNNQEARADLNGGSGDPCALVMPLNTWRLPNRTEMENIKTASEAQVSGHPGPNIYAPVRYIAETYPGGNRRGMYFGTQTNPGTNYNKYLFISFDGIYNNNTTRGDLDNTGWYMLKNGSNYEYMQIGPNIYTFNFYQLEQNTAVAIRCVKAN